MSRKNLIDDRASEETDRERKKQKKKKKKKDKKRRRHREREKIPPPTDGLVPPPMERPRLIEESLCDKRLRLPVSRVLQVRLSLPPLPPSWIGNILLSRVMGLSSSGRGHYHLPSPPPGLRRQPPLEPCPIRQPPLEPCPIRQPPLEPSPARQPTLEPSKSRQPPLEPSPVRQLPPEPSPFRLPSSTPDRTQLPTTMTPAVDSPGESQAVANPSPPVEPIAKTSFNSRDIEDGSLTVRSLSDYERIAKVGQGTFGEVFKAKRREDGLEVALKRIQLKTGEELPITAVRELRALSQLRHENIVGFYEVARGSWTGEGDMAICLVLEYVAHDLFSLMRRIQVDYNQAALLFKQLLLALDHCHRRHLLHRDLKTSNILITARGELKLADFGLCQLYDESETRKWTNPVITINYRPLELLLGSRNYGPEVDIWSAGAILWELLVLNPRNSKAVVFEGKRELEVMLSIEKLCGSVLTEEWPEVVNLPYYKWISGRPVVKRQLREKFNRFDPSLIDLLDELLQLNPARRLSAAQALRNPWLVTASARATPLKLPNNESHELLLRARVEERKRERPTSCDLDGVARRVKRRRSY